MSFRIGSKLIVLILFSGFGLCLHAQVRPDSLMNKLGDKYPQEKMYLQFDKSYYNAGETVWFKAYLLTDNFAVTLSKTVYAELLDEKGNLLQKKIMPVYESGAASNFDLPDTLQATKLYVRAYTSWMLNFDSSLLYLKALRIIPAAAKKTAPTAPTYSVTFFPEGGDLVEGTSTRIAFKANDQDGTPFNVSGSIISSAGAKITAFNTIHDGMGYFAFTPSTGEQYKAIWKDKKGVSHETPLPVAKKQGVILNVTASTDTIQYTLRRPEVADEAFTSFTIVAQMQLQTVYYAKVTMTQKKEITSAILTSNFPDGVLQLTVLNGNQLPVAERLVFVNHNTFAFTTDLHAIESNMIKRGHNTLQVDVGDTILTNLSIAVTDADVNPATANEENIFSRLMLTNDLKGYVYNPAYYFSSDEDSVKKHLDLVLMTNGWRRFKWEELLAQHWPTLTHPIDNYLSLKGSIYGIPKNILATKTIVGYIKTKSNTSDFLTIPLNSDGQFRITGIYAFDTAKFYYQINNDKDKKLTSAASFTFKNEQAFAGAANKALLAELFPDGKPDSTSILKNIKLAAQQRSLFESKAKTLEAVRIVGKVKSLKDKLEEQYTSGFFTGGDGYTFTLEDDPFAKSALTVMDYLRGKVAGLQVSTDGQSASWRGSTTSVFLDEINSDFSMIQNIPMNDVALIKVFRPPFFGATGGGGGGAIAVYTKKGGGDNSAVKGLDFTNIYGFSNIKEFYSPDYSNPNTPDAGDYRSTLYWNPFLIFDQKTRRIKIPFYNSDNCKRIRVIIEGINHLGQLSREEKIFE